MKMGYLQYIQSLETSIETGNVQSYYKQTIGVNMPGLRREERGQFASPRAMRGTKRPRPDSVK